MFEWFRSSLLRQLLPTDEVHVVIVDFWHSERNWTLLKGWQHVPPKPTVWQGPHRLTQDDYFAPSNARNTALCYAKGSHIVYVDDLSLLGNRWMEAVRDAVAQGYICCGAFQKVKQMNVWGGRMMNFEDYPEGHDKRWTSGDDNAAVPGYGSWLFGCSVVIPVSALEKINGWPEAICDASGTGAEDTSTGTVLVNTGHTLKYDRRLFTYESEELHQQDPKMNRVERGVIDTVDSMSWAVLRMVQQAKHFDNDFHGFPDVAALRRHILAGGQFPIPKTPEHLWYDGTPLRELTLTSGRRFKPVAA
jgi:hypothetical protein